MTDQNILFSTAVKNLVPSAKFSSANRVITEWLTEGVAQPTDAEIAAEITRLEADYAAKQYQRKRAAAYPSIADQLDQIYHEGIDAWKATIAAVKQEYPKP